MPNDRMFKNMQTKQNDRNSASAAASAIYSWLRFENCDGFPDLREFFMGKYGRQPTREALVFKITAFGENVSITRFQYMCMKAAWKMTEEGQESSFVQEPWL